MVYLLDTLAQVRLGFVLFYLVWFGLVRLGQVRLGQVNLGQVLFSLVSHRMKMLSKVSYFRRGWLKFCSRLECKVMLVILGYLRLEQVRFGFKVKALSFYLFSLVKLEQFRFGCSFRILSQVKLKVVMSSFMLCFVRLGSVRLGQMLEC